MKVKKFNQKRNECYSGSKLYNYQAYCLLFAVANYSENALCQGRAEMYLSDKETDEHKKYFAGGEGGFMTAILAGNLMRALRLADGSNLDALAEAINNNEIDFLMP